VSTREEAAAINRLIDSSADRDKNGVTERMKPFAMKHPMVAWNAPESFQRERIPMKKGAGQEDGRR